MNPITRATVQSFCRVCLQELALLKGPSFDIETENICKELQIVTSLEQPLIDAYPRRLCKMCFLKTVSAYKYHYRMLCALEAVSELLAEKLDKVSISNMQLFCRTCLNRLNTNGRTVSVQEVQNWINDFAGKQHELDENALLPQKICNACFRKLRCFVEFRSLAKQSFDYLQIVSDITLEKAKLGTAMPISNEQNKELPKSAASAMLPTDAEIEIYDSIFAEQLPVLIDIKTESECCDFEQEEKTENNGDISKFELSLTSALESNDECTADETEIIRANSDLESLKDFTTSDNDDEYKDPPQPLVKRRYTKGVKEAKEKKTHNCNECGKRFRKQTHYEAHKRLVHEGIKTPHACEQCTKSYQTLNALTRHIKQTHTQIVKSDVGDDKNSARPFTCELCGKTFKRKDHLRDHTRSVHENVRPFKCSYCDKTFAARKTVRVHEMSHSDIRPYVCEICKRAFRQTAELKIHMERHTANPQLLCPYCKRAKQSEAELQQHIARHKAAMQHQCPKCGKIFKKRCNLEGHDIAVHLKLKPYKCRHCDKTFACPKNCRKHELIHTTETPEICTICDKSFTSVRAFRAHMKKQHSDSQVNASKTQNPNDKVLPMTAAAVNAT